MQKRMNMKRSNMATWAKIKKIHTPLRIIEMALRKEHLQFSMALLKKKKISNPVTDPIKESARNSVKK